MATATQIWLTNSCVEDVPGHGTMGITLAQAVLLEIWSRRHDLRGSVLTLGVQHLDFSHAEFAIALGREAPAPPAERGLAGAMTAQELFAACGFESVVAVDVSRHEGADIEFDLNNLEVPAELASCSDLVVNGGTLEHVFHVPNALSNMTRMLRPGGSILHILPCHNCVDHGFYQFGPTFAFDYYAAAGFEILETAAVGFGGAGSRSQPTRVFPLLEGAFGTGLIGAMCSTEPLLCIVLVRRTGHSCEAAIPMQRLYSRRRRSYAVRPTWFAPFTLTPGERPAIDLVREYQLTPLSSAGGLGWSCTLPQIEGGDSTTTPIRSSLVVFEDGQLLGPPHTPHAEIIAQGGGAFSHWGTTLMISTSDGTDPRCNGRIYTAKVPVPASAASDARTALSDSLLQEE